MSLISIHQLFSGQVVPFGSSCLLGMLAAVSLVPISSVNCVQTVLARLSEALALKTPRYLQERVFHSPAYLGCQPMENSGSGAGQDYRKATCIENNMRC